VQGGAAAVARHRVAHRAGLVKQEGGLQAVRGGLRKRELGDEHALVVAANPGGGARAGGRHIQERHPVVVRVAHDAAQARRQRHVGGR